MDLSFLNKEQSYAFLMSAIYASTCDDNYMLMSDLVYALDSESFKNFITLFEGQTIKVPKIEEIQSMLTAMSILAYHDIDKVPMVDVLKSLGIQDVPLCYKKLKALLAKNKVKVGGILDEYPTK